MRVGTAQRRRQEDIAMPNFLQLPGGLPWWIVLAILVPAALYGLLFLAMPFSVFGVKGRLDAIESRLDDIQEELRGISFRLSDISATSPPQNLPPAAPRPAQQPEISSDHMHPTPRGQPEPIAVRRNPPDRPQRSEPRLDWPR
jgi:hypothetical protein